MPDDPAVQGRWDPVFALPDVVIHAAVLPTGTVLAWGRRRDPAGSMHQQGCAPFVWDPATGTTTPTDEPRRADGTPVNLFCSGHAFLPDGRLLVAGGHIADGDGLDQACVYDAEQGTWTALPVLRSGRWYPSAVTLADGRVLVLSGSHQDGTDQPVERIPEIGDGTAWAPTREVDGLPLYPRVHQLPDGRVAMVGSNGESTALDTAGPGTWSSLGHRAQGERQYGPSVMYEPGKVVYLGGGNDAGDHRPTAQCETIDLTAPSPTWTPAAPMAFRRRQHNATLLPDGTVLVTGGTSGPDFNDLTPGAPVHAAELWDPATDTWTTLASEAVDRCYHATAVLLPDATVLSAGGGEFVVGATPNAPGDSHRDAQVFRPPYLFRGPPPLITAAPEVITPGETFTVASDDPAVGAVTIVRASSATHTVNTDQRFVRLAATADAADPRTLAVTAPATSAAWPPGPALLFVLSAAGVPSPAHLLRVAATAPPPAPPPLPTLPPVAAPESMTRRRARASGTAVTVGLTAQCPYGLGPCWGGAYSALERLDDVAHVEPVPDAADQTAHVVLAHRGLPDLARWPEQLARWANASYVLRGVEVTLAGDLVGDPGDPHLASRDLAAPVRLLRIAPAHHVPWDLRRRRRRSLTPDERDAHRRLLGLHGTVAAVRVTGPLRLVRGSPVLSVRAFSGQR